MSVAFRRESDEEHREPRFERPVPPGPNLVTARGLALIQDEVAAIEARLAAGGDELEPLLRERRYWRGRLATARIAPPPAADEIGIGSRVRFRLSGEERNVEIVGSDEADPEQGRIGFMAPLARALIGAGAGDLVALGGQDEAIAIVAVDPATGPRA